MKHLAAALLTLATLIIAPPAQAAGLPDFCVDSKLFEQLTADQKQECDTLKELDASIAKMRAALDATRALIDKVTEADDKLQKQLKALLPKRPERPGEHIPSSPNEVRR